MKRHDRLSRRPPRRARRKRYLIVCEGEVTEPDYVEETRHQLRLLIDLNIIPGGDPKRLVERAVERKKESEKAAERSSDENLLYERIWCVFDVDDHKSSQMPCNRHAITT
jgi:hypothetical protein